MLFGVHGFNACCFRLDPNQGVSQHHVAELVLQELGPNAPYLAAYGPAPCTDWSQEVKRDSAHVVDGPRDDAGAVVEAMSELEIVPDEVMGGDPDTVADMAEPEPKALFASDIVADEAMVDSGTKDVVGSDNVADEAMVELGTKAVVDDSDSVADVGTKAVVGSDNVDEPKHDALTSGDHSKADHANGPQNEPEPSGPPKDLGSQNPAIITGCLLPAKHCVPN